MTGRYATPQQVIKAWTNHISTAVANGTFTKQDITDALYWIRDVQLNYNHPEMALFFSAIADNLPNKAFKIAQDILQKEKEITI